MRMPPSQCLPTSGVVHPQRKTYFLNTIKVVFKCCMNSSVPRCKTGSPPSDDRYPVEEQPVLSAASCPAWHLLCLFCPCAGQHHVKWPWCGRWLPHCRQRDLSPWLSAMSDCLSHWPHHVQLKPPSLLSLSLPHLFFFLPRRHGNSPSIHASSHSSLYRPDPLPTGLPVFFFADWLVFTVAGVSSVASASTKINLVSGAEGVNILYCTL